MILGETSAPVDSCRDSESRILPYAAIVFEIAADLAE